MSLDRNRARQLLAKGELQSIFIEELGWDLHSSPLEITAAGVPVRLQALAQKRGMVVYHCPPPRGESLPDYPHRRKIEQQVAKSAHEHLIVFTDAGNETQVWQWVKREPGKPAACREHVFHRSQPGDALLQKLEAIAFTLEEEERLSLTDVTRRTRAGFDVERVTKRFYDRFQKEHAAFLKFVSGITDRADQEWYASVMLNRLMFVYFIQRKGFLDGDRDYLRNRLSQMREEHGKDKFYSFYRYFLLRLFHEALGNKERNADLERLVGSIPYLNGGLFDVHELEKSDRYGTSIQIPDQAFERIFDYFDQYQWHLDERSLRADNEINPDVLGYIFEKYINQKQMGAYYTKGDITEYISKNTVLPFLFDDARSTCKVAFENPKGPTVWDLLRNAPDRYIYPAVRHGTGLPLQEEIARGLDPPTLHELVGAGRVETLELRKGWNKLATSEFGLPTETWREVVARRKRYEEIKAKLAGGEVCEINELITLNLDIRQFAQDVIENCEGPELLRALWNAIEKITVLDPTCGSGAFLFAAVNILEPLYEACLDRMEAFVEDAERSGEKGRREKFTDFRRVLERVAAHPNRRYFVYKSIILNNLFGVDIMEEAVEICKLRLFLKLAAQVDPNGSHNNLGIEPLPDIDFNIRTGNTLVGYPSYDEVRRAATSKLDFDNTIENISRKAGELQEAFDAFRARQVEGDGSVPMKDKEEVRKHLKTLEDELNCYLAGEYGVDPSEKDAYAKWQRSHQPFHWFIEFYRIMSRGGFDVIIGNPPYLEYSKVAEYRVGVYATERCANLYVYTLERSLTLNNSRGRVGMIVPISVACSGAMEPLRRNLTQSAGSLWLSHFSNRPGQLFNGAQNRLTIVVSSRRHKERKVFSTRYHRWDARNGERDTLFPVLRYLETDQQASMFHGLLPKVGCPEAASVLVKTTCARTLASFATKRGRHKLFWVRVPGYFCLFLVQPPTARPEGGGQARIRGEVNEVSFDDKAIRAAVHAILNSATYYQFFCTYTDTRHINRSDVMQYPLDLTNVPASTVAALAQMSATLTNCFVRHTTQARKSGLLIDSVDAKPCKLVIDAIDRLLATHYGLTEEELDFIINYDIKYRMGVDTEGDEKCCKVRREDPVVATRK